MEQVMEPSDQATVSDDPEACQYTINTITTPASPLPEEDIDEEEETMGDTPEETEGRAVTTAGAAPGAKHGARDSSWLELEVCREFLRKNCSRSADECRFAHPPDSVIVKDRKVTCCFDFLKDRCNRDTCKYLHPPNAIKDKLVMAGKQYGQQIATTYKPTMPIQQGGGGTPFNQSIPMSGNYISFVSTSPIPQIVPQLDTSAFPFPPPPPPQLPVIPPNIEVCEDFANNVTCPHGNSCYYAHPGNKIIITHHNYI
jgi:muscleblind protein